MFSKYRATKVTYNGIKFDSKLEANIYKKMVELGVKPMLQVRYPLQPKFRCEGTSHREIEYRADFVININGCDYILDAKGMETPEFKIKKKLFAYKYAKNIITIPSIKKFVEWYNNVLGNKK